MEEICIREIKINDYNDIYLLNQEFNPERCTCSELRVKGRIQYVIENSKDIILVCEHCNEVIGYIHGSPYELLFSDSLINVLCFVVKEEYRNIGVGSKLIDSLECWAKDNGFSGIKLLTHPNRIHAHRFYERHGYIHTKDQKNYMKVLR